jgi:hypothetical protein
MIKKYLVLLGLTISIVLFSVAIKLYPGGTWQDPNTVGFSWTSNFISNLFQEKALNGQVNISRNWADPAMMFLSASLALFFFNFSKKISKKSDSNVIKYLGIGGMIFSTFICSPMHDLVITIVSVMFIISLFFITITIIRSRLNSFKILCVSCLIIFYFTLYLFGSGDYELLAIFLKITFASMLIMIGMLEYFTKKEDFESSSNNNQNSNRNKTNINYFN